MTKNQCKNNNSEIRAEQVTKPQPQPQRYDTICLGADLHKASISVARMIDGATPQPAQRFDWAGFWKFVAKQKTLARRVCVVYEAGAFGFWPCRQLRAQSVECYVVHPEKLDPGHKQVQTDKLDARHLVEKLHRYVGGNDQAMRVVYVPTEAEEQARLQSRHREHLKRQVLGWKARGRGLLLSQGLFDTSAWWKPAPWARLQPKLSAALSAVLEDLRTLIEQATQPLTVVEQRLAAAAPKELPLGFGRLTFVLLWYELCTYQRFKNRRQVGGFTGLCGGVSSSGPYHADLSINKAGSPQIRAWLIELAWRMIYYQPDYVGLRPWKALGPGPGVSARRKKIALVAVARRLIVDLWRWQTGRVTAEQLGWKMRSTD